MKGRSRKRKVEEQREARRAPDEVIIKGRVSVQNFSSSAFSLCPTLMFKSSCKYSSDCLQAGHRGRPFPLGFLEVRDFLPQIPSEIFILKHLVWRKMGGSLTQSEQSQPSISSSSCSALSLPLWLLLEEIITKSHSHNDVPEAQGASHWMNCFGAFLSVASLTAC